MSNLPGDFNEDNIIGTGADLVYLLSNLTDLSNNYNYNNDLTKNNSITTKDVDYLANHVAGTQGYELPKGGIFTRSHALGNIAIGHGAIVDISAVDVSTENSIAIGNGASAIYNNSIAIGKDVSTTATNQIVLGDSNHNLVINGNLLGNIKVYGNPDGIELAQYEIKMTRMSEGHYSIFNDSNGNFKINNTSSHRYAGETEGINLLTIKNDGRVGIGTTSPDASSILHVEGNALRVCTANIVEYMDTSPTHTEGLIKLGLNNYGPQIHCIRNKDGWTDKTDLQFWTSGENEHAHHAMTIKGHVNHGNVGIGTTEPSNKLEIVGNTLNRGVLILRDDNLTLPSGDEAYTYDTNLKIDFKTDIWTAGGGAWYRYPFETGASIKYVPARYLDVGSDQAGYHGKLHFNVQPFNNETTRMTITSTGNVGIGTDNPKVALHISRAGDAKLILEADQPESAETNNPVIELRQDGGRVKSFFGHKSGSNHLTIGTGYGDILLTTAGDNTSSIENMPTRMRITSDGHVGIGTDQPYARLHVKGGGGYISSATRRYFAHNTGMVSNTADWSEPGIYAHYSIVSRSYIASHYGTISASDIRIKTNIIDVQDDSALVMLRSLKPKTYGYKDVINRGSETVYGFIAQEVGEIIPQSVQKVEDFIPNIYQLATVGDDHKTLCFYQGFDTQKLDASSNTLRILDKETEEHFVNIEEIIDASCVRVDTDLSNMMGDVDDSGNSIEGNKVFVYGQRVDDFNYLKKDAIWTVATAALQEVDRQLQAEKSKTASLESQVANLNTKLNNLLNKFNILETNIQNN